MTACAMPVFPSRSKDVPTPYAYIQDASDGQAWLFMDGEPLVPINRKIGQTICDRINADRADLLLAWLSVSNSDSPFNSEKQLTD